MDSEVLLLYMNLLDQIWEQIIKSDWVQALSRKVSAMSWSGMQRLLEYITLKKFNSTFSKTSFV